MKRRFPTWIWRRKLSAFRQWAYRPRGRDADLSSLDALARDARRRRHVTRVQDETLARVTFGMG